MFKNGNNQKCSTTTLMTATIGISLLCCFPPWSYVQAQRATDGTISINNDDFYTRSTVVSLGLMCFPDTAYCRVSITFDNQEANFDPRIRDTITNIIISRADGAAELVVNALETGLNTSIFEFGFDNSVDDVIPGFSFGESDVVVVEGIPLSSINGAKTVSAFFSGDFSSADRSDTIILDTIEPSTILTPIQPDIGEIIRENTPLLDWPDATDANLVVMYTVRVEVDDGDPRIISAFTIPSSELSLLPELDDGTYFWYVWATDSAGNEGKSSPAFTFSVDTIAPNIPIITAPESGTLTYDIRPSISGIADDDTSSVEVYLNNAQARGFVDMAGIEWTFVPSEPLKEGTYLITARSIDDAGNTSPFSDGVSVTIDTTPTVGVIAINDNAQFTNSTAVSLTISCEGSTSECNEMRLSVDGVLDDEVFQPFQQYSSVVLAAGDGEKEVMAQFRDTAGNISPAVSDTIVLDTIPPASPVITDPEGNDILTQDTTLSVKGTLDSDEARIELLDGSSILQAPISVSGSSWSYVADKLDQGSHTFRARAVDLAGNVSPLSNELRVNVDSEAPSGSFTAVGLDGREIQTTTTTRDINLHLSCTDGQSGCSRFRISFDGNLDDEPFEQFESEKHVTLPEQIGTSYSLLVQYADAAGNVSPPSPLKFIQLTTGGPPVETIVAGSVAVAAAVVVVAIKTGKFKIKNWGYRLVFEFGFEEEDTELERSNSKLDENAQETTRSAQILQGQFADSVQSSVHQIKEGMERLKEANEFVKFCRDAKHHPNRAISAASNKLIEKLLTKASPYFAKLFLDDVSAKIQASGFDGKGKKSITGNFEFDLRPIKPYLGLAVYVYEVKKFSAQLTFRIDTNAKFKNLYMELGSAPPGVTGDDKTRIDLGAILVNFELSLANVGICDKSVIQKPYRLTGKEFKIDKLSMTTIHSAQTTPISTTTKGPLVHTRHTHDESMDSQGGESVMAANGGKKKSVVIRKTKTKLRTCKSCKGDIFVGDQYCGSCGEVVLPNDTS